MCKCARECYWEMQYTTIEFAGSAQPCRFDFRGISEDVWVVMLLLSRSPSLAVDFVMRAFDFQNCNPVRDPILLVRLRDRRL